MKKYSLGAALGFLLVSPALSQTYKDSLGTIVQGVAPLVGCGSSGTCLGPVSASNPLPVAGSFSAGGFAPTSVGTPITATTAGGTGTLPAGTVVVATNVGTANGAYCALGGSSSTAQQYIGPNGGWFAFTVGSATQLTCSTSASTTTINLVGGFGLATGAVGGSGGGGGSSTGSNYGNQANWVSGSGNASTATQTQIIAAPSANKLYVTNAQCFRTDAGASMALVTFNDAAGTVEALPAGGGSNVSFTTPLVVAATTAFRFTPSAALSSVYCSAQGYNAP